MQPVTQGKGVVGGDGGYRNKCQNRALIWLIALLDVLLAVAVAALLVRIRDITRANVATSCPIRYEGGKLYNPLDGELEELRAIAKWGESTPSPPDCNRCTPDIKKPLWVKRSTICLGISTEGEGLHSLCGPLANDTSTQSYIRVCADTSQIIELCSTKYTGDSITDLAPDGNLVC